uniref:Acyltransferase 3 domain-containing protein n=1 Tax=Romanomermis culicivorax TaxID=13658 RepID=A0A915HPD2_ROMCU
MKRSAEKRKLSASEMKTRNDAKTAILIEILLAFSIYKNTKKIFDVSPDSTKDHVKCIHGIRALSIIWVIFAHSYSSGTLFVDNAFDILAIPNNILNQLMLNATLAVDAFFFMSGTLLAYLQLRRMKCNDGKHAYNWKKWSQLLAHRYFRSVVFLCAFCAFAPLISRLTPVYAFVLFVQIFLIRYSTDGPLWNPGGFEPKLCRTGWWTNLAYINNLISLDRSCMVWSWYLANDTQFFVISLPLIMLLWTNGTLGILAISLLIVATSIIRGFIVMSNDAFPPINIFYNDLERLQSTEEFTYKVYFSPHCRIGPYLVGLLVGYILFKYRKSFKLSMISNMLLWVASFALGLGVLFGMYDFCKTGRISDIGKAIYGSSCRVLWSLFLAWIVLAASTGHGGFINKFLSSKRWKPMSRLVYSAYLVHPIIMLLYYTSFMKPIHYEGHYQLAYSCEQNIMNECYCTGDANVKYQYHLQRHRTIAASGYDVHPWPDFAFNTNWDFLEALKTGQYMR